jgi:uncharacterized protein YbaR (Trm112 family)
MQQPENSLLGLLECPRDHSNLHVEGRHLCCALGHKFPVVNGVPVFLLPDHQQTIGLATESLKAAEREIGNPLYVNTLGLSEHEKREVERDGSWGRG